MIFAECLCNLLHIYTSFHHNFSNNCQNFEISCFGVLFGTVEFCLNTNFSLTVIWMFPCQKNIVPIPHYHLVRQGNIQFIQSYCQPSQPDVYNHRFYFAPSLTCWVRGSKIYLFQEYIKSHPQPRGITSPETRKYSGHAHFYLLLYFMFITCVLYLHIILDVKFYVSVFIYNHVIFIHYIPISTSVIWALWIKTWESCVIDYLPKQKITNIINNETLIHIANIITE